jgi:hypothetical protein
MGDLYLKGYVKLYRKILSNPVFKSPELLQLFIYCLLRANHEEGKAFCGNDEIKIVAGQFVTGRFELAKDLKQNESSTYKRLKRLETLHMVALNSNNKNTLVTVVNWELYQSVEKESNSKSTPKEQQSNNKVTTKEQQSNTNKNVKNDKNGRMEENKYSDLISAFTDDEDLKTAIQEFINMRVEKKKAPTARALELIFKTLNQYDTPTQIKMLEKSIINQWTDVFPLKQDKPTKPTESYNPFLDKLKEMQNEQN